MSNALIPYNVKSLDECRKAFQQINTLFQGNLNTAFSALSSGTNVSAAMLVGTGASLGPTGSGTITATAFSGLVPTANLGTGVASSTTFLRGDQTWQTLSSAFSALTSGTNTTAAMIVGTGASLNYSPSGTINASSLQTNFTVSGPTVPRVYAFPDAACTVLTTNALVTVSQGGTGAGSLTLNGVLLGGGTGAVSATAAGTDGTVFIGHTSLNPSFTATPTLGVAGSVLGSISFCNLTSGFIHLQAVTGALGVTATVSIPAVTGTIITTGDTGTVTNAMLAGSIAASKLIGSDIATVGTITAGTWNGTKIDIAHGGTNSTTALNNAKAMVSVSGAIVESLGWQYKSVPYTVTNADNHSVLDVDPGATNALRLITLPACASTNQGLEIEIHNLTGAAGLPVPIVCDSGDSIEGGFFYIDSTNTAPTINTTATVNRTLKVVTLKMATDPTTKFVVGGIVTVALNTNTSCNGTFVITSMTSTTIVYSCDTSGTITNSNDTGTVSGVSTWLISQYSRIRLKSTGAPGHGANQGWKIMSVVDLIYPTPVGAGTVNTSGTYTALLSSALPPGQWDLSANGFLLMQASSTLSMVVSIAPFPLAVGPLTSEADLNSVVSAAINGEQYPISIPSYPITNIFPKIWGLAYQISWGTTAPLIWGRLTCRRVQ